MRYINKIYHKIYYKFLIKEKIRGNGAVAKKILFHDV